MLIDVRSQEEYAEGHRNDAINWPLNKIMGGDFPNVSKDENIVLYCFSGSRAHVAKSILEQAGFLNVENLGGL